MSWVAVVTGASSGIGEATARRLAREPDARIVLVARREDRLRALAESLGVPATFVAVDLTDAGAPAAVAAHVREQHGRLDLLVNNAGAGWRARFADGGHANVEQTMRLNFHAQVRLTEALLPLLRDSAPSAIVNVTSVSGRVARAGSGAYSASKFALSGWSDALNLEEGPNGVHVGQVLPGFIQTEGFPAAELRARLLTRWMVSTPDKVAEAIRDAGPGGRAERYVPRPYALAVFARWLAPPALPPPHGRRRRLRVHHADRRRRARLALDRLGAVRELRVQRLLLAAARDHDAHLVAGLLVVDGAREVARVGHVMAVHRRDHVAGPEARGVGGAAAHHVRHPGAAGLRVGGLHAQVGVLGGAVLRAAA